MHILRALAASAFVLVTSLVKAEVVGRYAPLETSKYWQAAAAFESVGLLEQIAQSLNARVRSPGRIGLVAKECGRANAYYEPATRTVYLCYELMEQVITGVSRDFPNLEPAENLEVSVGALLFILDHEVAHALIHVLNLPILSREEDQADAIATYLLLKGKNPLPGLKGAVWFFRAGDAQYTSRHFGDEHSLGPQRQYNILCLAVGRDPQKFAALARELGLPDERARRCPQEYVRLDASVRKLLGRHVVQ